MIDLKTKTEYLIKGQLAKIRIQKKSQNLESRAIWWPLPPHCHCRLSAAENEAPQLQLYAAITIATCPNPSLTGLSPLRCGDGNIERLPPGSTTSKGSMNVYYNIKQLLYCYVNAKKSFSHLATRTLLEVATICHAAITTLPGLSQLA